MNWIGSGGKANPGFNLQVYWISNFLISKVVDDEGKPVPKGKTGNLVIKKPLPPATLLGLWNSLERLRLSYFEKFPGYFQTGDGTPFDHWAYIEAGYIDEENNVFVMWVYFTLVITPRSRTDDIMNVAGHRLSTSSIEEILSLHPRFWFVSVISNVEA